MPTPETPAEPTVKIADELKRLGSEVLARNHKAASEVRDAVRLVAEELDRTAEKLKKTSLAALRDEGAVQAHLALLEAKDRMLILDGLVKSALAGAAASPTFIGETARMKLALAKMDTVDLFEEKRRLLHEERRRFQTNTDAMLADLGDRLAKILSEGKLV